MNNSNAEIRARTSGANKEEFLQKMKVLGFANQEDFIMSAIRTLYDLHYINNETEMLPVALQKTIDMSVKKHIQAFANRVGSNINELNIQQQIIINVLADEFTIPKDELTAMRSTASAEQKNKKQFVFKQEGE